MNRKKTTDEILDEMEYKRIAKQEFHEKFLPSPEEKNPDDEDISDNYH